MKIYKHLLSTKSRHLEQATRPPRGRGLLAWSIRVTLPLCADDQRTGVLALLQKNIVINTRYRRPTMQTITSVSREEKEEHS